eukprot:scaffold903_cov262-Pinguiococcus_pyrenoidosus.AAC.26
MSAIAGKGFVFAPGEDTLDSKAVGMPVVHRYKRGDRPTGERWVMWYQGRGDDIEDDLMPLSTGWTRSTRWRSPAICSAGWSDAQVSWFAMLLAQDGFSEPRATTAFTGIE